MCENNKIKHLKFNLFIYALKLFSMFNKLIKKIKIND